MCKVYTGYCGTSEIEHGLCACTVDNPLAKARGLSLRTGAQPMLYLSLNSTDVYMQEGRGRHNVFFPFLSNSHNTFPSRLRGTNSMHTSSSTQSVHVFSIRRLLILSSYCSRVPFKAKMAVGWSKMYNKT